MGEKDLYEELIRFYEFQLGQLPNRQEFKEALQATLTEEDLRVFFLLPFFGMIPIEKLEQKAAKIGIPRERLHEIVQRLIPEGIIDSYVSPSGRLCGRAPVIALLEFQVRLKEDSPMRAVCVKVMNAFIEGAVDVIPTRTPYYRVLPVEATLTGETERVEIPIHEVVPDPRQVLPIDVISEMIKKEPIIAVADCYCRSTKKLLGEGCGHPLETCFYFNELAMIKLESGYGRRVDYDEAMRILRDCEVQGLVHNVSNCEGKIQTLCNCCACSCAVMKAIVRGQKNVGAPSRFVVAFDESSCTLCGECVEACQLHNFSTMDHRLVVKTENCIGCGQCVSRCPQGALRMVLRKRPPKIYRDNDALFRRINMEAMVGLVLRKLQGK
ncbi:MAG: 4Fe-4S binding protein [Chloroflexi bacterium]|nr:4Fe-4S binding protein [Chloroflexota bacterium]